ncbi:DUF6691 family protein [Cognatishimia sp. F0-27]|uniref:DUF6691 family protein n=1 Tax=Cognatishimia sp. F0-27 TaxID=2816855 RepID=UPI001D0C11E9|nr:DUF6691 family protein [Cognatishimia sp. F0-27]MCC1491779.1 hypothetical protein [Cognatishimia sp. F0-27]
MRLVISFLAGGLFGAGLHLSGMTNTAKVQGWLDVFGDWDPTLAFVMGGAMIPMGLAWLATRYRKSALSGTAFPPPPSTTIDMRLVLGSVFFGTGWGLVGLCPGPVLAALSYGGAGVWIFLAAMIAGMGVAPKIIDRMERAMPA